MTLCTFRGLFSCYPFRRPRFLYSFFSAHFWLNSEIYLCRLNQELWQSMFFLWDADVLVLKSFSNSGSADTLSLFLWQGILPFENRPLRWTPQTPFQGKYIRYSTHFYVSYRGFKTIRDFRSWFVHEFQAKIVKIIQTGSANSKILSIVKPLKYGTDLCLISLSLRCYGIRTTSAAYLLSSCNNIERELKI